ncbi:MAG TPA: hypothetical protein VMG12_22620 [Polyangiaceae bacterium]|nr:hypothetical protein [Polyangiaceae bacterium]
MSSTPLVPLVPRDARLSPEAAHPHAEPGAAETDHPGPPRDALDLMLLHGDCAFLLDLWAR